jgi:hypothetical protein
MKRLVALSTLTVLLMSASVSAYQYPQEGNEGSWNFTNNNGLAAAVVMQEKSGGLFESQPAANVNNSTNVFGGMLIGGGNVENVNFAESQVSSSGSGNTVGQTSSGQLGNSQQASGTQAAGTGAVTNTGNSATLN